MLIYGRETRALAVECYLVADRNATKAIKLFKQRCLPPVPPSPGKFIKFWGNRWLATHSLDDTPGRGRKTKVDLNLVRQAVKVFAAGYPHHAAHLHWSSFAMALRFDGDLVDLVRHSGVNDRTFWHYMLEVTAASATAIVLCCSQQTMLHAHQPCNLLQLRPSLCKVSQTVKFKFSESHLAERVAKAGVLREWPITKVLDMVFLDGSRIVVAPASGKVWVDMLAEEEREVLVLDERLGGDHGFQLVYYAAVNARLGPCFLWLCTGTTGLVRGFRVSSP